MPQYSLLATQVPAPQVPSGILTVASAVPTTASSVTAGASGVGSLSTPFNRNAVRLDLLGRWGGGGYAILTGCVLTAGTGASVNVSQGQIGADAPVDVAAKVNDPVTDSQPRVFYWLKANAAPALSLTTAVPTDGVVFLGSVVTNAPAGSVTGIDESGVMYRTQGGVLWRRTGDYGMPTDTPPASLIFLNITKGGVYRWNGPMARYEVEWEPAAGIRETIPAGEGGELRAGYQQQMFRRFTVRGRWKTRGHLRLRG